MIWAVVQPVTFAFIAAATALVAAWLRSRRISLVASTVCVVTLFIAFYTTAGALVVENLEDRFARPDAMPAGTTCMIVLGGEIATTVDTARGGYDLMDGADRYIEAVRLAQAHPQLTIIVSGGDATTTGGNVSEADIVSRMFDAFGIDHQRLQLDRASRDTFENGVNTRTIVDRLHLSACLLITSGFHMPRAVAVFRSQGITVIPWVADYRTTGQEALRITFDAPLVNAGLLSTGLREWAGMTGYYLTGRIDTIYPMP